MELTQGTGGALTKENAIDFVVRYGVKIPEMVKKRTKCEPMKVLVQHGRELMDAHGVSGMQDLNAVCKQALLDEVIHFTDRRRRIREKFETTSVTSGTARETRKMATRSLMSEVLEYSRSQYSHASPMKAIDFGDSPDAPAAQIGRQPDKEKDKRLDRGGAAASAQEGRDAADGAAGVAGEDGRTAEAAVDGVVLDVAPTAQDVRRARAVLAAAQRSGTVFFDGSDSEEERLVEHQRVAAEQARKKLADASTEGILSAGKLKKPGKKKAAVVSVGNKTPVEEVRSHSNFLSKGRENDSDEEWGELVRK